MGNDIVIALDSTGIKVANRGEWMRHKCILKESKYARLAFTAGLGPLNDVILYGYSISSISGFVFAWISTIVLLNQYSIRWKGKMHWFVVSLPLVYFLIQFQPIFLIYSLSFFDHYGFILSTNCEQKVSLEAEGYIVSVKY